MGPHIVAEDTLRFGDEAEAVRILLDDDVGVGAERELEDAAEDVGETAELLVVVGETQKGLSFGKWVSRMVLDGDVASLGDGMDLHGFGFNGEDGEER